MSDHPWECYSFCWSIHGAAARRYIHQCVEYLPLAPLCRNCERAHMSCHSSEPPGFCLSEAVARPKTSVSNC